MSDACRSSDSLGWNFLIGSHPAREEALAAARPRLLRLAYRIVNSWEVAEDVVQDASLRALRFSGAPVEKWEGWLSTIVVRRALTALKEAAPPWGEAELVPARSDQLDLKVAVEQVLAQLEPDHRAVLALAVGEGWSYDEIAEALEVPVGTVASRLHAAKASFRKRWER